MGSLSLGSGGTIGDVPRRFTVLVQLPRTRTTDALNTELAKVFGAMPAHLVRSLNWDQGKEIDIARGDIGAALEAAEGLVPPDNQNTSSVVSGIVGICRTWAGRFHEARPMLESSAANAPSEGEHLLVCTSAMFLAILALEDNDLGRARHYAQQALDHAEAHHLLEYHQLALSHTLV